jgi:hypothetical protein
MNRTPFSCRSRSGNHNTELGTSSSSNGRLMDKRTEKLPLMVKIILTVCVLYQTGRCTSVNVIYTFYIMFYFTCSLEHKTFLLFTWLNKEGKKTLI